MIDYQINISQIIAMYVIFYLFMVYVLPWILIKYAGFISKKEQKNGKNMEEKSGTCNGSCEICTCKSGINGQK